jgi:hypothetical protein
MRNLFATFLIFVFGAAPVLLGQSEGRLIISHSVAPGTFQIGQNPNVLFTLSQLNPNPDQQLQNGDTFVLTVDVPGGTLAAVSANPIIKSATLTAADFMVQLGSDLNKIIIRYIGPGAPFAARDSIGVKAMVSVTQIASGSVVLETPPERYTLYTIPNIQFRTLYRPSTSQSGRLDQPVLRVLQALRDQPVPPDSRDPPVQPGPPGRPELRVRRAMKAKAVPKARRVL